MKLVKSVLSASILAAAAQSAVAVEIDPYASLRANVIGDAGNEEWSDAYGRAGITLSEEVNGLNVTYNFEAKYDVTQEADNNLSDGRIRQNNLKIAGDFGSIAIGKTWSPFYNALVWGTGSDRFNGTYSGYETPLTLNRRDQTVTYTAPTFNGINLAVAVSDSGSDNHKDIAATYALNDEITLAAGFTNGDSTASKDKGLGIRYTKDQWTMTLNHMEKNDGATDYTNAYAGYAIDDNNYVGAHISEVSNTSASNPFTLGYTHKYNDDLKVFVEYYDADDGNEYPSIGFHYSL